MKMHSRGMRPTMTLAAVCAVLLLGGSALAQAPSGSATDDLIAEVPDALTAAVAIKAKLNQVIDDWVAASDDRVKTYQHECGIAGPLISNGPKTKACTDRLAEDIASDRTAAAAGGGGGAGGGHGGGGAGGGHGGGGGAGGGADVCEGDIPEPELLKLFTGCPPTTQGTIEYMVTGTAVVNCGNGQARYEVVKRTVAEVTHEVPAGSTTRTVVDSPEHCAYSLGGAVSPVEFPLPPAPPPLPEAGFWQEYGWLVATVAILGGIATAIGYSEWRASGITVLQPGNPPAGGGR